MTPTPEALTRVARAICEQRRAWSGRQCYNFEYAYRQCEKCQALARAAINAMENRDE